MSFACVYVSDFLVQAAVRGDARLRGRLVALIDGTPPLWRVIAASAAALDAGIQLGMTKSQAEQFCSVEMVSRSRAQEEAAHAALLDLAWSFSPRIEDVAADAVVLDLAGLASVFGADEIIAQQIMNRAAELELAPNVAIAARIETALLAARGFSGATLIPEGQEARYLGELPVEALGAAPEILDVFERWGVRRCAQLAALPVLDLSERLGQEGVRLHELARGGATRALRVAEPALHFEEAMELDDAVADLEPLSFILSRLLGQLCARLAARSFAAAAIRLRMDLEASFAEETGHAIPRSRYEKVFSFPVPLRDPKTLLRLLRLHLQGDPPVAPAMKISIAAEFTAPRTAQNGLFSRGAPDPEKLELTLARLAHVVGGGNVGSPTPLDTHRPDEFCMNHFAPVQAEETGKERGRNKKKGRKSVPTANVASRSAATMALRFFRPSVPARVEVRDGQPVHVMFNGHFGEVVTASGPWRVSGNWWQKDAWQQEEWDVELRFAPSRAKFSREGLQPSATAGVTVDWRSAVYRVYFDSARGSWFVAGVYD